MTKVEIPSIEKGYRLDAVAYTAQVEKTDLQDKTYIGPSVVTMSVAPSWVLNHGGLSNVKIVRLADDGTSQLLETQFSGIDTSINMVFTGTSPDGLSMFTLISVASQEVTVAPTAPPQYPEEPGDQCIIRYPDSHAAAFCRVPCFFTEKIIPVLR